MAQMRYEDFIKTNPLFKGIGGAAAKDLAQCIEEISLEKGALLINEGDESKEIYFLIEGELEVIKLDPESKEKYIVNRLHVGDSVGELALIDKEKRSASIKALTSVKLYRILFTSIENLSKKYPEITTIYLEIAKKTNQRLRETNAVAVTAMRKELEETKTRVALAQFLIIMMATLVGLIYGVNPLRYALSIIPNSSYISIPLILGFSFVGYLIIKTSMLPYAIFGITLNNWKKSVLEGLFFSIPMCGLIVLLKWLFIQILPEYQGHAVFEPFGILDQKTLSYWFLFNFIYCLFIPVQELLARGCLQGVLEQFLTGPSRGIIAIFISNLIFSATHVFLSATLGFVVFLFGLYFGWLFSRTHNLIGVIFAHCIIGVWGLSIVGPVF